MGRLGPPAALSLLLALFGPRAAHAVPELRLSLGAGSPFTTLAARAQLWDDLGLGLRADLVDLDEALRVGPSAVWDAGGETFSVRSELFLVRGFGLRAVSTWEAELRVAPGIALGPGRVSLLIGLLGYWTPEEAAHRGGVGFLALRGELWVLEDLRLALELGWMSSLKKDRPMGAASAELCLHP